MGFQDEVWWSRVTQPHLHAWAEEDEALRLIEQTAAKDDPDPKALACYGLLVSCPGGSGDPAGTGLAAFRRGPPDQCDHHAVPGLVLREVGPAGQDGVAHDLGQRLLAYQP